jgi:hypothetical protein
LAIAKTTSTPINTINRHFQPVQARWAKAKKGHASGTHASDIKATNEPIIKGTARSEGYL